MSRKRKRFLQASLAAVCIIGLLVFADQLTKYLAVSYLKGKTSIPLIQNVLELKYLENRGIAFGLFQGKISVFLLLCLLFFAAAFYCFIKIPKRSYYFPVLFILFLMTAGGVGNFIDRIYRGFVVDFIYLSLIDFPIFNLADIYVVLGGILLILFVCLKYKEDDFSWLSFRKKV